ncbi:hypothetical protein MAR_035465 [Mya arenaria]|uniref:Uncharacterized protein n=1 Tax=Mya arenaria TaxID=6604 RepID=A0ABY7EN36_MYAAR|nr:hypothetical protein MAR_035465 [Mya arenaria]
MYSLGPSQIVFEESLIVFEEECKSDLKRNVESDLKRNLVTESDLKRNVEVAVCTVKVCDEDVAIKVITLDADSQRAKVTLWRESETSDVRPGDFMTITDVVTVNHYKGKPSLSTTNRSTLKIGLKPKPGKCLVSDVHYLEHSVGCHDVPSCRHVLTTCKPPRRASLCLAATTPTQNSARNACLAGWLADWPYY